MEEHISRSGSDCPSADISPYIDGELSPARELELEMHFAGCECCTAELNLQKKFLIALDQALEGEKEIELPINFTKVIVTKAESNVRGLRMRSERVNAFLVIVGLFLVIVFALGASGSHTAFDAFFVVLEKVAAVGSCAAHVVYDVAVGAVAVLRSLSSHIVLDSSLTILFPSASAFYLFLVSRLTTLI